MRMRKAWTRLALFISIMLSLGNPLLAKRKDDHVVMKNGDQFTGEIRKLDNGILYFKSGYMLEPVKLDWGQVDKLESHDQFFVALKDGKRYTGLIEKSAREGQPETLRIQTQNRVMEIEWKDVIDIKQKENGFWSQLNGSVNYGLSYTSGNSTLSSALGAAVEYQRTADLLQLTTSSQFSTQSNGRSTNRYTFDGQYFRKISQRWFYGGLLDLLKSDQQDLNLRTTVGGGIGPTIVQTDKTRLGVFAGAVFSRERYFPQAGVTPINQNGEAVIGANFHTFRFRVLDIRSSNLMYPSLSDAGRVRLSSESDVRIELIKDLFWDFHLYENFDSRPPINAPRNDVGISTGLGWKF